MKNRIDGVNRTVLALLGLLLVAAGGLGLAVGLGVFGSQRPSLPLLPDPLREFAAEQPWLWWAIAAACVLLALIGLRWLAAQVITSHVGRLDLTSDESEGVTTLNAGAFADAVADDAETLRGVSGASAVLKGERTRRLRLTVDLTDHADIAAVRRQLEEQTVARAREALDAPEFPVEIRLRPDAKHVSRPAPS